MAAFPGWLASAVHAVSIDRVVLPLGAIALILPVALLRREARELLAKPGQVLKIALLPCGLFALFLWLRFPLGEIRQTEKPMDFAVLSSLLTTPSLPLMDPWLAGEPFSYYHFGVFLLALPVRLARVPPAIAYNLLAALLASLVGGSAFAAIRLRRGGRPIALFGSLFLVLGGTFDGARQILSGVPLPALDFWVSSRRVAHAITEWPLFTLRLGDLHPHALALPLLVALAGVAGRAPGLPGILLDAGLFGALLSSNPWDLPAGLLALAAGNLAERDWRRALSRTLATGLAAIPFLLPFLLAPRPPFLGLQLSPSATASFEAFLHFGALLTLPALACGVAIVRSQNRSDEALLLACLFPALGVSGSLLSARPVAGMAAGLLLAVIFLSGRLSGALRSGFLLASAGAILASLPDVVVVVDPYADPYRRMNTLFKSWAGAAPFFALSSALLLPLVLSARRARFTSRGFLLLSLGGALVHPLAAVVIRASSSGGTLDGMAWMSAQVPGDREAVEWLRANAPPDAVVAEAFGASYDLHGRIGTFSGRPTVLGWQSHESLWRGEGAVADLERRASDLRTLYTSADAFRVAEILKRRRIAYVAVGPLERTDFGENAFPFRDRFHPVLDRMGTVLYKVPEVPEVPAK